jgi:hypothetical protein
MSVCCYIYDVLKKLMTDRNESERVGFYHGLRPWKYLREGGSLNQWKIYKWKLKTSTTFKFIYVEIDERETKLM